MQPANDDAPAARRRRVFLLPARTAGARSLNHPVNHLVVTADDFGLSKEVNAAVEAAHRHGILTATSLMVGAPAAADAIERARRMPTLRVGLHVALVDADPVSPPAQVPRLLDGAGRLRNDLGRYAAQVAASPSYRQQADAEIAAQFEAYRATGLPLDHVNTHRHFHLQPQITASLLRIGPRYGMKALRFPVEPWRVVAAIDPHTRRLAGRLVAPWARWLRERARRAGLRTPDAVFGLAWSGAMTAPRVRALLARLPAGFTEVYLHPAENGGFPGAAKGYRYADEFAALCDPACIAAVEQSGFTHGGYADAGG